MKRPVLMSAVVTAMSLIGSMVAGVTIGALVQGLPFHAPEQTLELLVSVFIFGGGAIWGYFLARIHDLPNRKGALLAGVPIHIILTLLFVPATFLVATIGSGAILIVSENRARWFPSALTTGAAAALSFLVVDLVLDALGLRVGAPRAAERATMLTVAFLGLAAAAFSAGAILGHFLAKEAGHTPAAA